MTKVGQTKIDTAETCLWCVGECLSGGRADSLAYRRTKLVWRSAGRRKVHARYLHPLRECLPGVSQQQVYGLHTTVGCCRPWLQPLLAKGEASLNPVGRAMVSCWSL